MKRLFIQLLLFGCLWIAVTSATDIYVSPNGHDNNSGSQSSPFASITQAVLVAQPGDTISLESGTYTENATIALVDKAALSFVTTSGQADVVITIPALGSSTIFVLVNSNVSFNSLALNGTGGRDSCLAVNSSVFNLTAVNLSHCTSLGFGGAIVAARSSVRAEGCTFSSNFAEECGGAISSDERSTTIVRSCVFEHNLALNLGGGAIYCQDHGRLSVVDSTFTNNRADYYGGAIDSQQYCQLEVQSSMFSNNTAQEGGAIYCFEHGSTLVNTSSFFFNVAPSGSGGAIYNDQYKTVELEPVRVTGCNFAGNTAWNGGSIFTMYGAITVSASSFTGNTGLDGAAVYNNGFSRTNVSDCNFTFNTANSAGSGAIYNSQGAVELTRCAFSHNSGLWGGALYNTEYGIVRIENSSFTANSVDLNGGALFNAYNSTMFIRNSNFTTNAAERSGGGIYNSGNLNLQSSFFINNTADMGGAIDTRGQLDFTNVNISTCRAALGGGLYVREGKTSGSSSSISGCKATVDGGGVFFEEGVNHWSSCNFECNIASENGSNYFALVPNVFSCEGCTFNSACDNATEKV